ncbi:MAG: DNA repair protein RecO [Elainellaceae cyanobacterium]
MSGTYKATGINLKSAPLGEADRLLTILTEEYGLIRVVAPGARKHKSSLGGRSSLFVVNQLLIAKGRNLDKIIQAESLESYPGLSLDLRKLTAGQYLAELALYQALSDQPQTELYYLLQEHLNWLEKLPNSVTLACLTYATFRLLDVAGLAPQVKQCCVSQQPIVPKLDDPDWRIGFSTVAGGIVGLSEQSSELSAQLTAVELGLLQQFTQPDFLQTLIQVSKGYAQPSPFAWLSVERLLRQYAQYHFDRPIRSATLVDLCFNPVSPPAVLQTPS